jgi:hypothetical protein
LFRNKCAPAPLPEPQPALVVVVTTAPQLHPLDRRLAAEALGVEMVKLHELPLAAAMAAGGDERAASAVADPDRALDGGGRLATHARLP